MFCAHYRSSEHTATAAHGQGPAPVLRHHPIPEGEKTSWWAKVISVKVKQWKSPSFPWLVTSQHKYTSPSVTWNIPARNFLQGVTPTKTPHQAHASWEMKTFNIRRPWKHFLLPSLLAFFHTTSSGLCRLSHHLRPRNMKLCPVLPKNILNTGAVYWRHTKATLCIRQQQNGSTYPLATDIVRPAQYTGVSLPTPAPKMFPDKNKC